LFFDDFNRANTTSGLDNDWIVHVQGGTPPSQFLIESERAFPFFGEVFKKQLFSANPSAFRPVLYAQTRIRVSADVVTIGGSYDGLLALFARSKGTALPISDTYWCGFMAAAKKLYLAKLTKGTLEAIKISTKDILPLPNGTTSRLSLTIDGDQLACEITGAVNEKLSEIDTTHSAGYFGMGGGKPAQNTVRFDNFSIEEL
jgi:hypothetical protein